MTVVENSLGNSGRRSGSPDHVEPPWPAIDVEHLVKRFAGRGGAPDVYAIDDVSLTVAPGSTLGIVGESGSGKSTLARCLLGLVDADAGQSHVLGLPTCQVRPRELRALRSRAQIVFQEPYEALDPRIRIGRAIAEPLRIERRLRPREIPERVEELLRLVTLDPALADRYPHQLSGGQQQRANIARALATEPQVLVLDEPTSSLDVSVRSEILALLVSLQQRLGMTYVLISHDLPTIRAVCTDVAVMYLGRIVEQGSATDVLTAPSHPYTRFLLGSALSLDPDERTTPPATSTDVGLNRAIVRAGCGFAPRCTSKQPECETSIPVLMQRHTVTSVACHLAGRTTAEPAAVAEETHG
jgi:peptide/nickel transport system ATP-binding protein